MSDGRSSLEYNQVSLTTKEKKNFPNSEAPQLSQVSLTALTSLHRVTVLFCRRLSASRGTLEIGLCTFSPLQGKAFPVIYQSFISRWWSMARYDKTRGSDRWAINLISTTLALIMRGHLKVLINSNPALSRARAKIALAEKSSPSFRTRANLLFPQPPPIIFFDQSGAITRTRLPFITKVEAVNYYSYISAT